MVRLDSTIDLDFDVNAPAGCMLAVAAAVTPVERVVTEQVNANLRATTRWLTDPPFGNRLLHLRVDPGALHIACAATVDIRHAFADPAMRVESTIGDIPADVLPFLAASRYCQSDRLVEFAHAACRGDRARRSRQRVPVAASHCAGRVERSACLAPVGRDTAPMPFLLQPSRAVQAIRGAR
ncbi:MAG: hypothetical protein ABI440_08910 [Casimicrobiaceae bacterium]